MSRTRITVLLCYAVAVGLIVAAAAWFRTRRPPRLSHPPSAQYSTYTKARTTADSPSLSTASSPLATSAPHSIGTTPQTPIVAQPLEEDVIPGEFILRFYDERDRKAFEALAKRMGITVIDSIAFGHAVRIRVNNPEQLRRLLQEGPTPTDWSPNIYVHVPEGEERETLPPSGPYQAFGSSMLAWLGISDNANWGTGITIAVLDNGIASAAALQGTTVTYLDLVGDGTPIAAHGTAVASLIAGNDEFVQGVAPGADLLSIRVMTDAGVGDAFTLAKGIIEAVDQGARIINLSLGSRQDSAILRDAIRYAVERDVLLVAAAGNDAVSGVLYPACYDDVLAIAAVDANGRHLYFSNRGPEVDLAAPGAGLAAAQPEGEPVLFSGTSAATPIVAGTIAALLSQNPTLDNDAIVALLLLYSNDAGAPGKDDLYGTGVVDVGRLTERDTAGVYDMVAMAPYIRDNAANKMLSIDISAQNRGTETLGEVSLIVTWDGTSQTFSFYDIRVGDTLSQPFTFAHDSIANGVLDIGFNVIPMGVNDATPGNNAMRATIGL